MNTHVKLATASIAIVGLALTGCSTTNDTGANPESSQGSSNPTTVDGTGKTLTVLTGANSAYPEEQKQWFSDVSAAFQKETGATVVFETFASPADELTRIQTSVAAGIGPDVYGLGTTFTPTAAATGAFLTLGDKEWNALGGRDKFVAATLQMSGKDENSQVGVPWASRPFVMAYNTKILAEAGITEPARSWDQLREHAKKTTNGDVYGLAVGYADTYDPWKFIWAMAVQSGNPIIDGKTARIDDPITKKAYETYFGWLTTDKVVNPEAVSWKNTQALAAFAEGKAAYMLMTTANARITLKDSAIADSYDFSVMPTIPPGASTLPAGGKPATSIISGDNLVVANYSENQDLALAFVKFLTDEDQQRVNYELFGNLPTNKNFAASLQGTDPALKIAVEAAQGSVGTPFSGAWADTQVELVNVATQSIPALSAGEVPANELQSLLKAAQEKSQSALDKVR